MATSDWISGTEATAILSRNSGRPIVSAYMRLLARKQKIRFRAVNGRTNEYYRPDLERRVVKAHRPEEKQHVNTI